jgi:hypothetical protein
MSRQKQTKLNPDVVEFLKLYGKLIQIYDIAKLAEIFGVTRQAINYHINKEAKK